MSEEEFRLRLLGWEIREGPMVYGFLIDWFVLEPNNIFWKRYTRAEYKIRQDICKHILEKHYGKPKVPNLR